MTGEHFDPVLTTQADVENAWRTLIRPLGWSSRRLWFLVVGEDDRPLPILHEVEELPLRIEVDDAVACGGLWRRVLDEVAPGGGMALLLCRPGVGGADAADRASAAVLYSACRRAGVAVEVIHLATDVDIVPIPADALTDVDSA